MCNAVGGICYTTIILVSRAITQTGALGQEQQGEGLPQPFAVALARPAAIYRQQPEKLWLVIAQTVSEAWSTLSPWRRVVCWARRCANLLRLSIRSDKRAYNSSAISDSVLAAMRMSSKSGAARSRISEMP